MAKDEVAERLIDARRRALARTQAKRPPNERDARPRPNRSRSQVRRAAARARACRCPPIRRRTRPGSISSRPCPTDAPLTLAPGARALVPTGLALALPPGTEAQVRPRSGLAAEARRHRAQQPRHDRRRLSRRGAGDPRSISATQPFAITRGERIAQLVIAPGHAAPSSSKPQSSRATGARRRRLRLDRAVQRQQKRQQAVQRASAMPREAGPTKSATAARKDRPARRSSAEHAISVPPQRLAARCQPAATAYAIISVAAARRRQGADRHDKIRHQDARGNQDLGPRPRLRRHHRNHRPHAAGAPVEDHGRRPTPRPTS